MRIALAAAVLMLLPASARAEEPKITTITSSTHVSYVRPKFLPPQELAETMGARFEGTRGLIEWRDEAGAHTVEVRLNAPANLLILAGPSLDVAMAEGMIRGADQPPRQIAIEAMIVEVDESKTKKLGIDWDTMLQTSGTSVNWFWDEFHVPGGPPTLTRRDLFVQSRADLGRNLRLLQESGAATIRNAPHILTLNNRRASILDGQRVTYITRYSSFTNLFVTDSLDAGLKLSVLPSLGEAGYLTMNVRAELTRLASDISGSPVKDGQMVENTVIVKDGEPVLLGGFERTTESRLTRRVPVLGYILPFLFSRHETVRSTTHNFVVLTPHVVDLAPVLDERTKKDLGR